MAFNWMGVAVKKLAVVMILAGLCLALAALVVDVSVAAPEMSYVDPALTTGRVANWDMIGQREVLAIFAAALFVSGWIALAVDAIKGVARRMPEPTGTVDKS